MLRKISECTKVEPSPEDISETNSDEEVSEPSEEVEAEEQEIKDEGPAPDTGR